MNDKNIFADRTGIEDAILRGDVSGVAAILEKKGVKKPAPKDIHEALSTGIETARMKLRDGSLSIPEFLLSIDAFRAGLSRVSRHATQKKGIPVFIGVVEGDVHDLGKNIVAAVLSSSGYSVTDMGRDVTRECLRRHIGGNKKAVVALSSMMSTSLGNMKEIIGWLRETAPGIKIIVGGASLDREIAASIGADGFAESAVTAPDELKLLLTK